MPINATPEYFAAERRYQSSKSREEKILALEEMIRVCPKHKGTEHLLATLRGKLAKLKKESRKRSGPRKIGIRKEGYAQVCILGNTNSGKSLLLSKLTKARPKISQIPYTTIKPEIGTMDYKGIKIQVIEIPSTFDPEYMSIARTSDLIVVIAKNKDEQKGLNKFLEENYIRQKKIFVSSNKFSSDISSNSIEKIRENIWKKLGMIIVYAKKSGTPMALKKGSIVEDFVSKIHKDFLKNFRFARIIRKVGTKKKRIIQAGLKYNLKDEDVVEIHTK